MAAAFEIRRCSQRNAPTGMMPVSECRRRKRNDVPWPARNGATPGLSVMGAAGLAVATMTAPCKFRCGTRTFYYVGGVRVKSRQVDAIVGSTGWALRARRAGTPVAPLHSHSSTFIFEYNCGAWEVFYVSSEGAVLSELRDAVVEGSKGWGN